MKQMGIVVLILGSVFGISAWLIETGMAYWGRCFLFFSIQCFAWGGLVFKVKEGRTSGKFWTYERKLNPVMFLVIVGKEIFISLIFTFLFIWSSYSFKF